MTDASLTLDAGRELDALIAVRVMGIAPADVRVRGEVDTPLVRVWNASPFWRQDGRHDRYGLTMNADAPPYSTDIAAAWKVVERLKEAGHEIHVTNSWPYNRGSRWMCEVCSGNEATPNTIWHSAKADTAPLAICRAALSAAPPSVEHETP